MTTAGAATPGISASDLPSQLNVERWLAISAGTDINGCPLITETDLANAIGAAAQPLASTFYSEAPSWITCTLTTGVGPLGIDLASPAGMHDRADELPDVYYKSKAYVRLTLPGKSSLDIWTTGTGISKMMLARIQVAVVHMLTDDPAQSNGLGITAPLPIDSDLIRASPTGSS